MIFKKKIDSAVLGKSLWKFAAESTYSGRVHEVGHIVRLFYSAQIYSHHSSFIICLLGPVFGYSLSTETKIERPHVKLHMQAILVFLLVKE